MRFKIGEIESDGKILMRALVRGVIHLEPLGPGRVWVCDQHTRIACDVIDDVPVLHGRARDAVFAALRDGVLVTA